jgi:hypothetical protein
MEMRYALEQQQPGTAILDLGSLDRASAKEVLGAD